jgi:hypothetical protein
MYIISYIYLGYFVRLCVCVSQFIAERSAILFSFNNQTDQGDETEGLEREGYGWRDRQETDRRGRM